jgi:hypothetical protein
MDHGRAVHTLVAVGLVLAVGSASPRGGAGETPKAFAMGEEGETLGEKALFRSFALYVLSRGKGVPDEAWEALGEVRALAEADREKGIAVTIQVKRIGLEGERRLCVEYQDEERARRAHERARAVVEGVDLTRLVIEACDEPDEEEKEGGEP